MVCGNLLCIQCGLHGYSQRRWHVLIYVMVNKEQVRCLMESQKAVGQLCGSSLLKNTQKQLNKQKDKNCTKYTSVD